jgi:hypothetical protein
MTQRLSSRLRTSLVRLSRPGSLIQLAADRTPRKPRERSIQPEVNWDLANCVMGPTLRHTHTRVYEQKSIFVWCIRLPKRELKVPRPSRFRARHAHTAR